MESPVPAWEAWMRAEGLRPRGSAGELAVAFTGMLPSASHNSVGDPGCRTSRLKTSPASAPVNASWQALRPGPYDSGQDDWLFLSCMIFSFHCFLPVIWRFYAADDARQFSAMFVRWTTTRQSWKPKTPLQFPRAGPWKEN